MPKEKGKCPCSESQTGARSSVGSMEIPAEAYQLLRNATIPSEFKDAVREIMPNMTMPYSTDLESPATFPEIDMTSVEMPTPRVSVPPVEMLVPSVSVSWPEISTSDRGVNAFYLTGLMLDLSGVRHMTPGLLQFAGCPIGQLMMCGDGDDKEKKDGKVNGKVTIPSTSLGSIPPPPGKTEALPGWCTIVWILTGDAGGHKSAQGATDWRGFNKALGTPTQRAVDGIAKDIREANKIFKASPCNAMQLDLCKVYVLDTSKIIAPDQPGGGTKKLAELVFTNGIVYGEGGPDPIDWLFRTLEVHFRAEFNRKCIHLFYVNDAQELKGKPDLPGKETKGFGMPKNYGGVGEPYTPMGVVEGGSGRNIAHEVIHATGHEFHVGDEIPDPDKPVDKDKPEGPDNPKNKDVPGRMELIDNMKKVDDEFRKDTSSDQAQNIMQKTPRGDRILSSQCKIIQDFAYKFLEPCSGK